MSKQSINSEVVIKGLFYIIVEDSLVIEETGWMYTLASVVFVVPDDDKVVKSGAAVLLWMQILCPVL